MLNLNDEIRIVNLSLVIKDNLIISDIHLGIEEEIKKKGFPIIKKQLDVQKETLKNIFEKNKITKIVINGDIKHEFGTISEEEWKKTKELFSFLNNFVKEIILIKGNHDILIEPIVKTKNIKISESYKIGDIEILHGDKIMHNKKTKTIIIGHEHPAISISDGKRKEYFPCYLIGKYKNCNLIVQPSFNMISIGNDILKEEVLSPYLKQDLNNFDVYVVADTVYYFGKIKNLKF